MTQKTQKKFMLGSFLVGIGTTLFYTLVSNGNSVYSIFGRSINVLWFWALWWGVFIFPYLVLKVNNSSITSFIIMTLFFAFGFIVPELTNTSVRIKYIIFYLSFPEIVYAITIGILSCIYYSSQKQALNKVEEDDQNVFIVKLKAIYKPYSIIIPILLVGSALYLTIDFPRVKTSYFASIFLESTLGILIISSLLVFILVKRDFNFFKALILVIIIELSILTIIGIYGLLFPAFHDPFYVTYSRLQNSIFSNFLPIEFYIQVIFLVILVALQIGCIVSEIPGNISNSRYDRSLNRMQKKLMRKYATSKTVKEEPLTSPYSIGATAHLFTGRDDADYQKFRNLRKIEETLKEEEQQFLKEKNSQKTTKTTFLSLPKTAFLEQEIEESNDKPSDNIDLLNSEIGLINNIHYFLNGSWISSRIVSIFLSLSLLYVSMVGLNTNNWDVLPFVYIPVGIVSILACILLILPVHPNFLLDFLKNSKKDYSLLIFVFTLALNVIISIIFPNFILFVLIPEIYLLNPFLSSQLQKKQMECQVIDSPLFNLVHLLRLIIWPIMILNTMLFPHKIGLHIISFLLFVGFQSLYLIVKIRWANCKYFIISDMFLSFGLLFASILLTLQDSGFLHTLSLVFGFVILGSSGLLFHIQYFNIKIHSEGIFTPISDDMSLWLNNRENVKRQQKSNKKSRQQEKLKQRQEEWNQKQKKIHHEQFELKYPSIKENKLTRTDSKSPSFDQKAEHMCPICKEMLHFDSQEIRILREQEYLFCPNCREKVSINEILEPSYNSLIFEHKKILEDMENKRLQMSENNVPLSNNLKQVPPVQDLPVSNGK